ncbi:hypothetical protein [Paraburkholderia sediminicola]|uniref:hypothetical protein n=1 Tax=Paraburkholderia sediminicola TaxID=458836 RepID=UPI0038B780BD
MKNRRFVENRRFFYVTPQIRKPLLSHDQFAGMVTTGALLLVSASRIVDLVGFEAGWSDVHAGGSEAGRAQCRGDRSGSDHEDGKSGTLSAEEWARDGVAGPIPNGGVGAPFAV